MNIHFSHCVPTESVQHISLSRELNRKSTKNFYNLGIYSKENKSSSTKFGKVTFKLGSVSIARFMEKIALSFLGKFLRKIIL